MEMRLIKHVLKRAEQAREVPVGTDGDIEDGGDGGAPSENRHGALKLITEPYATGVATIKAIKDRISPSRSARKNAVGDGENADSAGAENGIVDGTPTTEGPEPCLSLIGRSAEAGSLPDDQWKAYSRKYRDEHDKQRSERRIDATGIEAFKFELIEVDRAWWRMKVGDVPGVAIQVWEALEMALPVHLIAEDAQISARECVFWLTVFKRHLDLQEAQQSGRCVYSRDPELQDLPLAVEQKVRSLH